MKISITIYSYKKAQGFKKDYVRMNGKFLRFEKLSASHKYVHFQVEEGDEFDARASRYRDGATRWDAARCQSWAKFIVKDGEVKCLDFNGEPMSAPDWIVVHVGAEVESGHLLLV